MGMGKWRTGTGKLLGGLAYVGSDSRSAGRHHLRVALSWSGPSRRRRSEGRAQLFGGGLVEVQRPEPVFEDHAVFAKRLLGLGICRFDRGPVRALRLRPGLGRDRS